MGDSCRYSHDPDLNRHHLITEYKDELVDDWSRDWIRRQCNDRLVAWSTGQVIEKLMTAGSPLLDARYEELVKAVAQRAWNVVIRTNVPKPTHWRDINDLVVEACDFRSGSSFFV